MSTPEPSQCPLVFLSHAGQDSHAARELAQHLKSAGLDVWLDVECLEPGDRWMEELEKALHEASAFVVYVGRSGVRNWVDNEIRVALDKSTKDRGFRLIPVLGPGADPDGLPAFLKQYQWQDFRDGFEHAADLKALIGAVSDTPPEDVSVLPAGKAPFRGLLAFDVDDAPLFFGRDQETEDLLQRLLVDPFLAVVGDSGSGKSSLVRAGLTPAFHRGRFHDGKGWVESWKVAILRPGEDPLSELLKALPDLKPEMSPVEGANFLTKARGLIEQGADGLEHAMSLLVPRGSRTLLVVDQFEELFTLTSQPDVRRRFIDTVLGAAKVGGERPIHVIVTLRADFYSECWQHEDLLRRVGSNQYLVRRVGRKQLREVIEKPLTLAGARAEAGVVDAVLHDVGDEPGNLPLLEHALLRLWERRKGNTLTHQAYKDIGRLSGALEEHADTVFDSFEDEREKDAARKIFLNLTQLGEGAQDTRRRARKVELIEGSNDDGCVARVLQKLADVRLVTTSAGESAEVSDDDMVEVAHEALIREWQRLRKWVAESRDSLRVERRVLLAAKDWHDGNRHPDLLARGIRLNEAEEWASQQEGGLPSRAREFLEASTAVRDEETKRERERQKTELETARRLTEEAEARARAEEQASEEAKARAKDAQRSARRTRSLSVVLVVLAISASFVAWFALQERNAAQEQRIEAEEQRNAAQRQTYEANYNMAKYFEERALSALERARDRNSVIDYEQAWLYAAAALKLEIQPGRRAVQSSTLSALLDRSVMESAHAQRWFSPHLPDLTGVVFSPDGKTLASPAGRAIRLWNAMSGEKLRDLLGHSDDVLSVAFSPDGNTLVSASENKVLVWNVPSGNQLHEWEPATMVGSVAISPDGKTVAATTYLETILLWDSATREGARELERYDYDAGELGLESELEPSVVFYEFHLSVRDFSGQSVAFNPADGNVVASASHNNVVLRNVATGDVLHELVGHTDTVTGVVFSPDGRRLASVSYDRTIRLWNVASGREAVQLEAQALFSDRSVAFSPDGKTLASPIGKNVQLWDVATGNAVRELPGHAKAVESVSFSPDGKTLASASYGHDPTLGRNDARSGARIKRPHWSSRDRCF